MAQYFFDFRDAPANGLPVGLTGHPSNTTRTYHGGGPLGLISLDAAASEAGTATRQFGLTGVQVADAEILAKVRPISVGVGTLVQVGGLSFYFRSETQSSSGVHYEIGLVAGSGTQMDLAFWNPSYTNIGTNASGFPEMPVQMKPYWMRAEVRGTNVRIRAWADGVSEPASWGVSATNSGKTTAGFLGVLMREGRRAWALERLGFGTDSDPAPSSAPGGNKTVSGVVRDDGGNPAQRIVRLYARDNGVLLGSTQSDAVTGSYSFSTTFTGEVQAVAMDDVGGTAYNDLILRTTPV